MTASRTPRDTVDVAASTPEREQPYAALGLKTDEYERIRAILDRRPTSAELAMYSVMWSAHCSYKSSKVHLRRFGEKVTPEMRERLMVGMGQNAGVIDVGEGWAVTFKIESHNHPSFVEPFQGAATGVGGIVRDIISMGARPVAVMDALRFGAIDHPDTARVVHGVVGGISFYGNCLGLPNIGGETVFDPVYQGNPLVNALAVGVLRHEDLHLANATGTGNKVVLFGARTGGDGIGGASILASESFDDEGPAKRPAVQVGDPFAEKVLIECCLELYAAEVVEGIQDLGAAGISCATSELAANGGSGMRVELDHVLLRDPTLTAEEILMSESQERMMAIVAPEKLDEFLAITAKWDVETSVLGEVTGDGRLVITHSGETIDDVDPKTVAIDSPVYERPMERPIWQDALQADTASALPRVSGAALGDQLRTLTGTPNLADASWISIAPEVASVTPIRSTGTPRASHMPENFTSSSRATATIARAPDSEKSAAVSSMPSRSVRPESQMRAPMPKRSDASTRAMPRPPSERSCAAVARPSKATPCMRPPRRFSAARSTLGGRPPR